MRRRNAPGAPLRRHQIFSAWPCRGPSSSSWASWSRADIRGASWAPASCAPCALFSCVLPCSVLWYLPCTNILHLVLTKSFLKVAGNQGYVERNNLSIGGKSRIRDLPNTVPATLGLGTDGLRHRNITFEVAGQRRHGTIGDFQLGSHLCFYCGSL